ncbi:D-glycero-alpha-D-manno-heptose-1,7-bisphosphate 7-phosphatase [Arthrobacter roseus]|uniref:D-glycero-alpha-D-manno-heptose-1,7-bisphosphate 7-phosphatase n=1 Tax=Arthrobacter roseus TaxID=136274 RepID=UPI00196467B8|nr:HAD family hydrolase [Arthrobacter roseus]MBM7847199.1 HAD superfamily hydrolase (TIGR01662 family) [Arthrobacter roseus]
MERSAGTHAQQRTPPRALLLDRDGTLIIDVPYNGDPDKVRPLPGTAQTLAQLRSRGIPLGVLTNQSGIARGHISRAQADAVNSRVDEILGPFDLWEVCPHGPDDSCACRKPAPGMILNACEILGLQPHETAFIGDIGTDVDAAQAAGATGVLIPTPITLQEEIDRAELVADTLADAVALLWNTDSRADSNPRGSTDQQNDETTA